MGAFECRKRARRTVDFGLNVALVSWASPIHVTTRAWRKHGLASAWNHFFPSTNLPPLLQHQPPPITLRLHHHHPPTTFPPITLHHPPPTTHHPGWRHATQGTWPTARAVALLCVDRTQSSDTWTLLGLCWHNLPGKGRVSWEVGRGRAQGGESERLMCTACGVWRERVQGKGSDKWREANRRRQLQTATQPGHPAAPPNPPGGPLGKGRWIVLCFCESAM